MTARPRISLHYAYISIYLFIFAFTFLPYVNELPRGIHQWAQADRIALAYRFWDGQPLNEPATLSMKTTNGETGVEFSGYQFALVKVMKSLNISKKFLPVIYRTLTFTLFFTALFALVFRILRHEHILFRASFVLLMVTSPILLYYGYNFLPDILALTIILWCFYLMTFGLQKNMTYILLLAGLALFMKTSSGIYFLSFYGVYFIQMWKRWDKVFVLNTLLMLVIATGVAYYDYNLVHLRTKELNSMVFLSSTRIASSWNEFLSIFGGAKRFLLEYLNPAQWVIVAISVAYQLRHIRTWSIRSAYFQITALVSLGIFSLILLFGIQYKDHDYYVISTIMPILIPLTLLSIKRLAPYIQPRTSLLIVAVLAAFSFSQGSNRYYNRMSESVLINGVPEPYPRNWLIGASDKIEPIVDRDDLVMVVYVQEPNHALVYLDRKGATFNAEEMSRGEQNPLPWFMRYLDAHYVVCPTKRIEQFRNDEPRFFEDAEIRFQDNSLTLLYGHGY